ncbi:hypothetical protein ACFVTT_02435 [Streptomyces niveus]|uniref:hypothetical protein n=1 Tax=Streptomyces niveus TaxID=193462 RepID=UPI0034160953
MTDDESYTVHAAACPVTPSLAEQIVGLAEHPWDWEIPVAAMRRLGWRENDDLPLEETLVTPEGHLADIEDHFALSFAFFYQVGGVDWGEDFWGTLPGWSSHENAGRDVFDRQVDHAIAVFTEHLGAPERDISSEGGTPAMGRGNWRHAAWRRGSNLLVVGPRHEGLSYSRFEEAVVCVGSVDPMAELPDLREFIG